MVELQATGLNYRNISLHDISDGHSSRAALHFNLTDLCKELAKLRN